MRRFFIGSGPDGMEVDDSTKAQLNLNALQILIVNGIKMVKNPNAKLSDSKSPPQLLLKARNNEPLQIVLNAKLIKIVKLNKIHHA